MAVDLDQMVQLVGHYMLLINLLSKSQIAAGLEDKKSMLSVRTSYIAMVSLAIK